MLNTVKHLLQTADNWWRDFIANMDKHRDVVVENVIKVLACGTTIMGHSKYCCSNSECSHTKVVPYTCKSRFWALLRKIIVNFRKVIFLCSLLRIKQLIQIIYQ
ncbi:transposase zinc-binding domain-containing protein [Piscirickettsia salmonis]|uniref:transposase zinc-binding domain-containing protein n=2 Tax=Piscirickettsia salmonis TaxID=1238 RepID=UPI00094B3ADB